MVQWFEMFEKPRHGPETSQSSTSTSQTSTITSQTSTITSRAPRPPHHKPTPSHHKTAPSHHKPTPSHHKPAPSPLQRHEHGEEVGDAGEAPEDGDDGVEAADLPVGAQGPGDEPQQAEGLVDEEGEEVATVRHSQAEQAHVDPVP